MTLNFAALNFAALPFGGLNFMTLNSAALNFRGLDFMTLTFAALTFAALNFAALLFGGLNFMTLNFAALNFGGRNFGGLKFGALNFAALLLGAWMLAGGSACGAATSRDAAPLRDAAPSRSGEPIAGAQPNAAAAAQPGPASNDAPPTASAPPVGDSTIRDGHFVVGEAAPGLVEFVRSLPPRGALWLGKLSGNGGRDVLVFVPPDPDPGAPFELVYHFHGTYSESIERERPGRPKKEWVGWNRLQQTLDAADELQRKRAYNVALVYPISAGKRREPGVTGWNNKHYDRMWMHPTDAPEYRDSFDLLHREVTELLQRELGVHPSKLPAKVLVEGHSAGGIALLNIAVHSGQKVREYLFLDASFQDWADGVHRAVRETRSGARVTLVITEGGIADPFGKRDPWCTRLEDAAKTWPSARQRCSSRGDDETCRRLAEDAEAWPDYRTWCEGMKTNMRDVPDVLVHRTRVPHGDQPRHFTGGLELPDPAGD